MFFQILIITLLFSCLYFIYKIYIIGLNIVRTLKKMNNLYMNNLYVPIGRSIEDDSSEYDLFEDEDFTMPIIRDDISFHSIEDWYETEGFSLEEITITEEKE